jgi:hypothetical protein
MFFTDDKVGARVAPLGQSCSGRARRGQEQTRFAARYASDESNAALHGIVIGQ